MKLNVRRSLACLLVAGAAVLGLRAGPAPAYDPPAKSWRRPLKARRRMTISRHGRRTERSMAGAGQRRMTRQGGPGAIG